MSATYASRIASHNLLSSHTAPTLVLDQSSEQSAAATLACLHSHILVCEGYWYLLQCHSPILSEQGLCGSCHSISVQCVWNTLNAEAKSIRLLALVDAGGFGYGFGKVIIISEQCCEAHNVPMRWAPTLLKSCMNDLDTSCAALTSNFYY